MANPVSYRSTLDKTELVRLTRAWRALNGDEIRFGAMAPDGGPAPEHTGRDGRPKGISTNTVLGWIEFGTARMAERPVIRWVQQTRRREIQQGAAAVARAIGQKKAHVPKLHALGELLRDATRNRIVAVDAVDTGQTLRSIHYAIDRRGRG